jgi:hypothetical protein
VRQNVFVRSAVIALPLAISLVACDGEPGVSNPTTSATAPVTPVSPTASAAPVAQPSEPATPPPTRGETTTTCVNGWITPKRNTPQSLEPLGIVRRTTEVEGPLVVMDMRYFTGPESPASDKGYLAIVERWYIRLYAKDDPAFQGRFLVEARRFGRGLSAVAPFDSNGFRSPDWVGFQYDSSDLERRTYPGLPGTWSGEPYDFVTGAGGDFAFPGLPDTVSGCLDGT